jgi:hypothetical protein
MLHIHSKNARTCSLLAGLVLALVSLPAVRGEQPFGATAPAGAKAKISPRPGAEPRPVRMATLEPTGMAKPIADLRDYNGTYYGASGTGTIGYQGGTLYRDNEDGGAASGCQGEGCGRHPGVDIPVGSGTAVFASLAGTVVRSECNGGNGSGWGGLIVIRSTNPWNPGETLYFTYAHLRARYYQVGQWVNTGWQIGESGGKPGVDQCTGNSTGGHLHFQIDKDDGNTDPWFPASTSALNQRDTDFQVTAKTYNPIIFVTGGYRWSFNRPGDREWWDLFNFQSWGVSNDALWIDGGNDPYIRRGGTTNCGLSTPCSSGISAEAGMYPRVYLDLYNVCLNNPGKIYFTTSSEPNWDEAKSVEYYPGGQGPYQQHISMNQNSHWQGIITGLRIDPAVNCNPNASDPTYFGEITIER